MRTFRHGVLAIVAALWGGMADAPAADLPATPQDDPRFTAVDDAILAFMKEHKVGAATLAVGRRGKLLHERAFGFADKESTKPVTAAVRMRIASVSKPITAAALKSLVRDRRLKMADPVMKYLPAERYPAPADARWKAITLAEVLEHKGGWDRAAGDPMFQHKRILADLKLETLTPRDVVKWMLTQPLQFNPGTKSVYSNFGYCLLGVVIEEVTGRPYDELVRDAVARPAGMTSLTLSSSDPKRRNADETWYDFGAEGEKFLIEPMAAHGGWVCTAGDLARFLDTFWISGEQRSNGRASYTFFGSLPGTISVAVQRPDGVNYALMINKRDPRDDWNGKLKALIEKTISQTESP